MPCNISPGRRFNLTLQCQSESVSVQEELRIESTSAVDLPLDSHHACLDDAPKEESSTVPSPTCNQGRSMPHDSAQTIPPLSECSAKVRTFKEDSSIPFPPQFYTAEGHLKYASTSGTLKSRGCNGTTGTMGKSGALLEHQSTGASNQCLSRVQREFKDSQELDSALHEVFLQFARFGNRSDSQHLDSFRFMKLCRECCLTTDLGDTKCVDLIFYQVCSPLCREADFL
jgi:hypothetical protein